MALLPIPAEIQAQATAAGAVRYLTPSGDSYLVVHLDGSQRVFVNRCPHRRLPLDRGGHVVFSPNRQWLICGNHRAKFDPQTGVCIAGPCIGKSLEQV